MEKKPNLDSIIRAQDLYREAKWFACASGYTSEVLWQQTRSFDSLNEAEFLREAAWVILSSGFRESVVRRLFSNLSLCFCDWESAASIAERAHLCRSTALDVFKNERKIDAILNIANRVYLCTFDRLKVQIRENPIAVLKDLPFIGPVTAWHLAKNLGFDVAKPDRHLVRLAEDLGFSNAQDMCRLLSQLTGDLQSVVDIVLWRYCATVRETKTTHVVNA
jgi:hypothetical protein